MWISLADVADNFLVFAWSDLEKKKQRDPSGLSAFIVERAFKGFSSGTLTEKWGILAGNTGFFKMDEVEVPAENLVGREGEGFKIAMFALDQGRYTVAAGATGLIRACRDASAKYALERRTFGVEIGQHQLVKEMIAQMESDYQSARLLWLRSGWLKNSGRRNTRETGLAKWFATVASERAAGDAVQIHGANGYSDEYPVGRFYRNCKGAVIYEGTREIHKLMQADYVLGYRADKPTRCELPPVRPASDVGPARRSVARTAPRRRAGRGRVRADDGPGRQRGVGPGGGRGDARDAGRGADRRDDRDWRGRARQGADALHRRAGRSGGARGTAGCRRWTSPSIRSRARTSARRARRTRSRCWPPRHAAACCTRPISTWRRSSSARARRHAVGLDRPVRQNLLVDRAGARAQDPGSRGHGARPAAPREADRGDSRRPGRGSG